MEASCETDEGTPPGAAVPVPSSPSTPSTGDAVATCRLRTTTVIAGVTSRSTDDRTQTIIS